VEDSDFPIIIYENIGTKDNPIKGKPLYRAIGGTSYYGNITFKHAVYFNKIKTNICPCCGHTIKI